MFKKHIPLKEVLHNDPAALISYIVGVTEIVIFFLTLGAVILIYTKYARAANAKVANWLAWSIILCAVSRAVGLLCVWHGSLYTLNAILCNITGMTSIVAVFMMIPVVRRIIPIRDMEQLNEEIEKAKQRLQTLQNLKQGNAG